MTRTPVQVAAARHRHLASFHPTELTLVLASNSPQPDVHVPLSRCRGIARSTGLGRAFFGDLPCFLPPSAPGRAWSHPAPYPSWLRGPGSAPLPQQGQAHTAFLPLLQGKQDFSGALQNTSCSLPRHSHQPATVLTKLVLEKRSSPGTVPLPEQGEVMHKGRPKMRHHVLYMGDLYLIEHIQADFYFSVSQIMMISCCVTPGVIIVQ